MKFARVISPLVVFFLISAACRTLIPVPEELAATAEALSGTAVDAAQTAAAGGGETLQTAQAAAGTVGATVTVLLATAQPTIEAALTEAADLFATARAAAGTLVAPSTVTPEDAEAVITTYAQEVLGVEVTVRLAGGLGGLLAGAFALPSAAEDARGEVEDVATTTYAGLLSNGAASVSLGSGTVSGNIQVDIQDASVGAFSIQGESIPATEAEALALVKTTFPGLADRAYTPVSIPNGFAWTAEGQAPGATLGTFVAERMLVGVDTSGSEPLAFAVVGRGTLAPAVQFPEG